MKVKKEKLKEIIKQTILEDAAYEKFFKDMLKDFSVDSPAELSADKKKEFFSRIKSEWSAKKESVNEALEPGDVLKHKHVPGISIELVAPTNKGWKVKQTGDGRPGSRKKKPITAYFDSIDIEGPRSQFVKESVNEATNIQKTLGKDLANTLKISPSSLSFGAGGFAPKRTKDGNVLVVIGLDTKVKRISLPQADFFGKEITYGGYLVVKANPNTGNLIKILGRYENPNDISLAKYTSEFVNEAKGDLWYIMTVDEFGDDKIVKKYDKFDKDKIQKDFDSYVKKTEDGDEVHFMKDSNKYVGEYLLSVVNKDGKHKLETTKGNKVFYKPYKMTGITESKGKYVVVSLSPRGGGSLMTKPTTRQKAEKYAKDFPAPAGETQKVVSVDDARKIKHLVGKEDLNESKEWTDKHSKIAEKIYADFEKALKKAGITDMESNEADKIWKRGGFEQRVIDLYKSVAVNLSVSESVSKLDRLGDRLAKMELQGKENTPEYKKLEAEYKRLERKTESVDSLGYWKDPQSFRDEFIKRHSRSLKIKGWTVTEDDMTGTFYWNNPKSDKVVLATPFWESKANIPINVMDDNTGDDLLQTSIPLKATKNFDKDAKEYIKKMTQLFSKLRA